MAQSFNSFYSDKKLLEMSFAENTYYLHEIAFILNNNLIVDDNLVQELNKKYSSTIKEYFNPSYIENGYLVYDLYLNTNSYIYFSIPGNTGWTIKDNNQEIKFNLVNG
ncbi:MAG: hypothetical protein RR623_09325 [Bacilli bacterium]